MLMPRNLANYNPDVHKKLLLDVVRQEQPDMIVFSHSSYGWDLAPRLAVSLNAAQFSEVVAVEEGALVVPTCNSKLRRTLKSNSSITIVTLQAGAFTLAEPPHGSPDVKVVTAEYQGMVTMLGYEAAEHGGVDLTKADVIVSAGRGIGKTGKCGNGCRAGQGFGRRVWRQSTGGRF